MAGFESPPWQEIVSVGPQSSITKYVIKPKVRTYKPFASGIRALFGGSGITIDVSGIKGVVKSVKASAGTVSMGQDPSGKAAIFGEAKLQTRGVVVAGAPITGVLDGKQLWTKETDSKGMIPYDLSFATEGEHQLEMFVGEEPNEISKRLGLYSSILFCVFRVRLTGVANPDPWQRYNGRAIIENLDTLFWTTQKRNVIGLIGGAFETTELAPVLKGSAIKFSYGNSADGIYDGQANTAFWDCKIEKKSGVGSTYTLLASGKVNRNNPLSTTISY